MTLKDILAKTDPGEFGGALGAWAIDPNLGGLDAEQLRLAPPLVKAAIYVDAFHLTIVNSGMWKWLVELDEDGSALLKFLKMVRAERAEAYLREALELFPDRRVPEDLDERLEICDRHERELRDLDKRCAGAADDAVLRLRDYVARNRARFEGQVRHFWKRHRQTWQALRQEGPSNVQQRIAELQDELVKMLNAAGPSAASGASKHPMISDASRDAIFAKLKGTAAPSGGRRKSKRKHE